MKFRLVLVLALCLFVAACGEDPNINTTSDSNTATTSPDSLTELTQATMTPIIRDMVNNSSPMTNKIGIQNYYPQSRSNDYDMWVNPLVARGYLEAIPDPTSPGYVHLMWSAKAKKAATDFGWTFDDTPGNKTGTIVFGKPEFIGIDGISIDGVHAKVIYRFHYVPLNDMFEAWGNATLYTSTMELTKYDTGWKIGQIY